VTKWGLPLDVAQRRRELGGAGRGKAAEHGRPGAEHLVLYRTVRRVVKQP
jgi:hypothetical protein